jgi:hypothetical protein
MPMVKDPARAAVREVLRVSHGEEPRAWPSLALDEVG